MMCSHVFIFPTELLSSNKKYGVKQRQYKLFAGEFGYISGPSVMLVFRPFFDLVLWSELHQRRRGMV
jgi:hypothetical protein